MTDKNIVVMSDSGMVVDFGDLGESQATMTSEGRFDATYHEWVVADPVYPENLTTFRASELWPGVYIWNPSTDSFDLQECCFVSGPESATLRGIPTYSITTGKSVLNNIFRIDDSNIGIGSMSNNAFQAYCDTTEAWFDITGYDFIMPNGSPGGPTVTLGDEDAKSFLISKYDPSVITPDGEGRIIHEAIGSEWALEQPGVITLPDAANTQRVLRLGTGGTNGEEFDLYAGDSDPTDVVTAIPGSLYNQVSGTTSKLWQHRGTSADDESWVEVASESGGSTYTHGTKTRTQMIAISSPTAGDTVYCSTYKRPFYWTGNSWQCGQTVEVQSADSSDIEEGHVLIFAVDEVSCVELCEVADFTRVAGVCVIGGDEDDYITMAVKGIWNCKIDGACASGNYVTAEGTAGIAESQGTAGAKGVFAICADDKDSTGTWNTRCLIGLAAEIY